MRGFPRPSPSRRSPLRRHGRVLLAALLAAVLAGPSAPPSAAATTAVPADSPPAPAAPVPGKLTAEVVGYLPYWEMNAATFDQVDLGKVSTIILFSVGWDAAGRLRTTEPGYRAITSSATRAYVGRARAAGVRVLVSFTSFGYERNAAFYTNATAQATFVREAAAFVAAHGLDGADVDVELIEGRHFDAYAANVGALRARLRAAIPSAVVTVATNGNTSGARMAAKAIAAGADRAFLMGYGYRSAGSSPGSIDPLARRSGDGGLSLTSSLELYARYKVPFGRLILGLPLYGRTWPTVDASLGAARRPDKASETFTFKRVPAMRAEGTILAEDHVGVEMSARLVRSVDGVVWQSFYDGPGDLKAKLQLVLDRGLAGAGLWALGYTNGRPEYWTAIHQVLGAPLVTFLGATPSPTNRREITVVIRWRNGARPATEIRLANGSGAFSAWRPLAPSVAWTLPTGPAVAWRTIRVQIRDDLGTLSRIPSRRMLYDRAIPSTPAVSIAWSSTARAWILRYSGRDVGSGVAGYRIVLKRNGRYTTLATTRRSTSYTLRLPRSAHFLVAVRTIDKAGNASKPRFVSR